MADLGFQKGIKVILVASPLGLTTLFAPPFHSCLLKIPDLGKYLRKQNQVPPQ